ncbi:MAG: hypothetical protein ACYTHK_08100 [Planctomycetota bacterium]|jgi:hypothetical protein
MRALVVLLGLLSACAAGRDSLADGERIPDGAGLVVGKFDFSGANFAVRFAIREGNDQEMVLAPRTAVFGVPVPPGRYKVDYIDMSRSEEELWFEVKAGEAVYIGSWYSVLGMDMELRDESHELAAEFKRRWNVVARNGMPGSPRRIAFEMDPILADRPGLYSERDGW